MTNWLALLLIPKFPHDKIADIVKAEWQYTVFQNIRLNQKPLLTKAVNTVSACIWTDILKKINLRG